MLAASALGAKANKLPAVNRDTITLEKSVLEKDRFVMLTPL
jgi:hypothetical protein